MKTFLIEPHQGGAHMKEVVGRSFTWFLQEQDEVRYQLHHQAVIQEARSLAWRCLIGVVIDQRLFPGIAAYPTFITPIKETYPPLPPKPWWQHYVEVIGKGQWLSCEQGEDVLTFVCEGQTAPLSIPLRAIVSYRSAGFPKVAYNVEQFLIAYISILEWLETTILTRGFDSLDATRIHSRLNSENYPRHILTMIKQLVSFVLDGQKLNPEDFQRLEESMIQDMQTQIPLQCKGMYHHAMEWDVPEGILQSNHPLVQAYLQLRKSYPNIVPGGSFVRVK
jgi:hypothetical protein